MRRTTAVTSAVVLTLGLAGAAAASPQAASPQDSEAWKARLEETRTRLKLSPEQEARLRAERREKLKQEMKKRKESS